MQQINLNSLSNVDITARDKSDMINIISISVNSVLPIEKRIDEFLKAIKNPYCFLCGDIPVKLEFAVQGKPLDEKLTDLFIKIKNR